MPPKTLAGAFEHTLHGVCLAEHAITKALPKVIDAVSNGELKTALKDHLAETKGQIKVLDAVFKSLGKKPDGEKCDAIEGLITEAKPKASSRTRKAAPPSMPPSLAAARPWSTTRSRAAAPCRNGDRCREPAQ